MTSEVSSRTLVLSVVSVDLVGYSQKSIAEQMTLKDNFNRVLLRAINDISIADRIILDTGDGVAMGFLGDPEDALYVAMFMHDVMNRDGAASSPVESGGKSSGNVIRAGINLGPVKLAIGVGGHPNLIGDGVNVAERIMSFAEPGQLTASRSFFQVMSKLSDPYAALFTFAGERTDKQVRSHDVYLIGKSAAAFKQAERGVAERAGQFAVPAASMPVTATSSARNSSAPLRSPAKAMEPAPTVPPGADIEHHTALINFLEDRNKVAVTATLLAVVAVILGALLGYRKLVINPAETGSPLVAAVSPAPTSAAIGSTGTPPPAPVAAAKADGPAVPEAKQAAKPAPLPTTSASSPPAATKPAPAPVATPATVPAATVAPKVSERPPAATTAPASTPAPVRDKPKEPVVEKAVRDEIRSEPRKAAPPRTPAEREKSAPVTSAPYVPSNQPSVVVPRPESVAPTPTLAPPPPAPAPRPDTSVVVASRTETSYPVEGVRQGITRVVVVKARLSIDAGGNVTDVNILEGGPIAAFARESRITLKQWKFNPGAAGRSYDIELTFKP